MNFDFGDCRRAAINLDAGGSLFMRRISTLFEIILSATLLILALYTLQEGSAINSSSAGTVLILGAVCFTLGLATLVSAFRSILWHRHMLRHSAANRHLNGAAPKRNHG